MTRTITGIVTSEGIREYFPEKTGTDEEYGALLHPSNYALHFPKGTYQHTLWKCSVDDDRKTVIAVQQLKTRYEQELDAISEKTESVCKELADILKSNEPFTCLVHGLHRMHIGFWGENAFHQQYFHYFEVIDDREITGSVRDYYNTHRNEWVGKWMRLIYEVKRPKGAFQGSSDGYNLFGGSR